MSTATGEPASTAQTSGGGTERHEYFFPSAAALRRSRFLLRLFMLNWLVLGLVLLTVGARNRPVMIAAFAFGLVALIAGLAQRQVLRQATVPLLALGERALELRALASAQVQQVPWAENETIEWSDERTLQVHRRADGVQPFSVVALDEAERARLRQAVRARLAQHGSEG